MQNYPTELIEEPRPLCFVLSELGGAGGIGDRLVATLLEGKSNIRLRFKTVPLTHRFTRKKEVDLRQRAPDGRPLETYIVRGLLKTAWLRRQFLERPAVVVVVRRVTSSNKDLPDTLSIHLDTLREDLSGRDVRMILVLVLSSLPGDGIEAGHLNKPVSDAQCPASFEDEQPAEGVLTNGTADTRCVDSPTPPNTAEQPTHQGTTDSAPSCVESIQVDTLSRTRVLL
jgi:hypothetical protein